MKSLLFSLPIALLLGACAGDTHLTEQSPQQPSRFVEKSRAGDQGRRPGTARTTTLFARSRIYQITRLETADAARGEWRALGETIKQNGSSISFTEIGSGRTISFTAPHQITPTSSVGDRGPSQMNSDVPSSEPAPSNSGRQ